jgi:hypothetical protein
MNLKRIPNLNWPRDLFSEARTDPGVNGRRPKLTIERADDDARGSDDTPITHTFHVADIRHSERPHPMF